MNLFKKILSLAASAAMTLTFTLPRIPEIGVSAAGADKLSYPVQEFRFGIGDTDRNLNISGNDNGDHITSATFLGDRTQKWYLNYISSGVYEIVNSQTGYIVTNNNGVAVTSADVDGSNQRWKIEAVEKDFEGNDLYYKIVSNADNKSVLTFNTASNSLKLDTYTGSTYQKFKLNLDGLEGFAGNCKVNGKEKAGTIGGLLGETVFCNTVDQVVTALDSADPKTVVVTANLDFVNQRKDRQQIRDNKTLVGSYNANTITDCQFRNDDLWGEEEDIPSGNIVIRNINFKAQHLNEKKSGNILLAFYGVRNLWLDHNSFSASFAQDRDNEVGKFVWINTPAKGWADDKWNAYNPDYITASYNSFLNRYWTFAFGSQNTDTSRLHTTLMFNKWEQCSRRCPQYSNGYDHNYNNYHTSTNGNNPNISSQVIGGEGSRVINENCRFEACGPNELDVDRNLCISFTDSGSYTSDNPLNTPSPINFKNHNSNTWKVEDCYGYHMINAYNSNGKDVKEFCNTYSGSWNAYNKIRYITDTDCASYIVKTTPQPFLKSVAVGNDPITGSKPAIFTEGSTYMIKNVNSGLYIDVDGANAANGTNCQQWGAVEPGIQNTWKLISAGDDYYYIVSAVGDGGSYVLDISGKSSADGANAAIYSFKGTDNQKFKFIKNADGSYKILTKISGDKSGIEVKDAATSAGSNVQQWTLNGVNCQDWILEPVTNFGCTMDTNVIYEFKNLNSGMVMDIESGKMEENTNVQQWSTGHFASQQWILQKFSGGGNYYYIRSTANPNYVLKAMNGTNGGNLQIVPYSTKDSMMLFKFSKNPDGTYNILTRSSKDGCMVEIADASKSSGANVQQWSPNGNNCQKWEAVTFTTTTTTTTTTTKPVTTTSTTTTTAKTTAATTTTIPEKVKGDVNDDGKFNISDLVMIQQWILEVPNVQLKNWEAADLCEDGRLDSLDLVMMRKALIKG